MTVVEASPAITSFGRPEQTHATTLSVAFPRSFHQAADLVIDACRLRRAGQVNSHDYTKRCNELVADLDKLRAKLLYENFYYRLLGLDLAIAPEMLRLARTSSDWRVALFLSLLDADYPEFEREYEFLLNLFAANSKVLRQTRFDEQDVATAA
jgi:hypothetical protein